MKLIIALSAVLTLSVASPLANPNAAAQPQKGTDPILAKCSCKVPICPLELIAECRCKNNAAQACYENWLAQGVQCPKPTPQVCGVVARETKTEDEPYPLPSVIRSPTCGGIQGKTCPDGYKCVDDPRDTCDPNKGGRDCIGICVKRGIE